MYEYKVFEAENHSLTAINVLLEEISRTGWEPVQIDAERSQVLAKRLKTLND